MFIIKGLKAPFFYSSKSDDLGPWMKIVDDEPIQTHLIRAVLRTEAPLEVIRSSWAHDYRGQDTLTSSSRVASNDLHWIPKIK